MPAPAGLTHTSEEEVLGLWPAPPAQARLAYVQNISGPIDLGLRPSRWSRITHLLTGQKKSNYTLVKPLGIALDEDDNICVTDTGTALVWYFDQQRKSFKSWGKIGSIKLVSPVAIAKRKGTFFVADSSLGTILAFDDRGKLRFEIQDEIKRPAGLAIFGDKLYVADASSHRVAIFSLAGEFLGAFGQRGAAPGEFNFPTHVAITSDGRILVTDSMNARVQIFDAEGKFLNLIGGIGDGSGYFSRPKGVAVDAQDHVYVTDALFDNFQIFDLEGHFLLTVGKVGSAPGDFWLPSGIAISKDNHVYVADSYNRRVQVFKYLD